MSKPKTLLDFFTKSPALKSPSQNGTKSNDSIESTPKSKSKSQSQNRLSKKLVKRKTVGKV